MPIGVTIDKKKFASDLKKLCKTNRVSQKLLAKELGLHEVTLIEIKKTGRTTYKTIQKLEKFIDIRVY